jgi:hypothetical protein
MAKVELESFFYEPSRRWFVRRLIGESSYESQKYTYWRGEWARALADAQWSLAMRQAVEDHQQAWAYTKNSSPVSHSSASVSRTCPSIRRCSLGVNIECSRCTSSMYKRQ